MQEWDREDRLRRATASVEAGSAMPRTFVVIAHPDDEVLAVGARLGRFRRAHFLQITDGAPRNGEDSRAHGFVQPAEYRAAREAELAAAFRLAGVEEAPREGLAIADQEASHALVELTEQVLRRLRALEPEVVITHPYEGGHPDHDACAFAVHHAARLLAEPTLVVAEAAFYNTRAFGGFLPRPESPLEINYELSARERERKAALLGCFQTQQETLRQFPLQYERYRLAPRYVFHEPPHAGELFYERFPWGMSGARFRELAAEAERLLAGFEAGAASGKGTGGGPDTPDEADEEYGRGLVA